MPKYQVTYKVPVVVSHEIEVDDGDVLEEVLRDYIDDGWPLRRDVSAEFDTGDVEILRCVRERP